MHFPDGRHVDRPTMRYDAKLSATQKILIEGVELYTVALMLSQRSGVLIQRYTAEQIIGHLRQAEIRTSEGKTNE